MGTNHFVTAVMDSLEHRFKFDFGFPNPRIILQIGENQYGYENSSKHNISSVFQYDTEKVVSIKIQTDNRADKIVKVYFDSLENCAAITTSDRFNHFMNEALVLYKTQEERFVDTEEVENVEFGANR